MLRTFIALTLEPAAQLRIAELGQQVKRQLAEVDVTLRPTKTEQLHLTLAFLGDTDPTGASEIIDVVARTARQHEAFTLPSGALCFLPKPSHVQVVALEFDDVQGRARALVSNLVGALEPLGFEFDSRPFLAHVTLLRTRKAFRAPIPSQVDAVPRSARIMVRLSQIGFFASHLEASGARHELLAAVPLKAIVS